jgi:hypothetical protein
MLKRKRSVVAGASAIAFLAVHVVLGVLGAVALWQWLGGIAAALLVIVVVALHTVFGPRLGHGPRTPEQPRSR